MAEVLAVSLTAKVAAALSRTAAPGVSSIFAIRSGIVAAGRELDLLSAFLRMADSRHRADELTSAWVAQVRDTAFELEDVVDEYSFLCGHGFVRGWKHIKAWFALARRLRKARERLRELSSTKEQYDIRPAEAGAPSTGSGGVASVSRKLASSAHFVEEDAIVGFAMHRRLLMEWLTNEADLQRTLVAVWGMGGVGKTTLVTSVYNQVSASCHFDCAAWVAVSQSFTTDDLLKKIVKELHRDVQSTTPWNVDAMDYRALVTTLREHLGQKRYLVVLDDVWDADAWFQHENAFVDNRSGSRVVITTRSREVAALAAPTRMMMLEPLPKQESWTLFCNTVFREDADRRCPSHLESWALRVVDKCGGLPLAIVSVANLLSLKEKTECAWRNVHDSIVWDESYDHKIGHVASILNLSINDLPYELKKCFLFFSKFPEDFSIKRKILIRQWIAEGFIKEKGQSTMEEVADNYLNDLVQRSLLQVAKKNVFGRTKRCHIHDLVRELTLNRSKEERFFLSSRCTTRMEADNKIRHLTLDRCKIDNKYAPKMTSLRSFHALLSDFDASLLSCFRLLTVLNLWFLQLTKLPPAVVNLVNLRYLGIRSTLIDELPKELGKLKNLQTLDAKWSMIQRLPSSITNLKRLRHLILFRRQRPDFYYPGIGVKVPEGLHNLSCLQTLKFVEADDKLARSLESLEQMRSLELSSVDDSNITDLLASISKMRCLLHLGIASRDSTVTLDLGSLCPLPLKLQKLALASKLIRGVLPSWFCSLTNLMQLHLCSSGISADSIGFLSSLPKLLHLTLVDAYSEKCLTFTAGSFPVLVTLALQDMPNLARIEIQKGSLVDLRELILGRCTQLRTVPQGINKLAHLQKMKLSGMPTELVHKLQEGKGDLEVNLNSQNNEIVKNLYLHNGQWLDQRMCNTSYPMPSHREGRNAEIE